VQELKTVRAQQEALKTREKALLDKIAQKVEEQRKALQKAEELLRQLQTPPTDKVKPLEASGDTKKFDTIEPPKSH
jgi:hypothetical protein